jgi:hypothetical protein
MLDNSKVRMIRLTELFTKYSLSNLRLKLNEKSLILIITNNSVIRMCQGYQGNTCFKRFKF